MNDPLGGSPIRDHPGTVRGDPLAGAWVKVGRVGSAEQDSLVDTTRGERVSDYAMWLMKLPVVGVVPGSLADHDRKAYENAELDLLKLFVGKARDWLDADPEADTDEDVVRMVLDLVHGLWMRAQDQGRSVIEQVAGIRAPTQPCPDELCVLAAGHPGSHHLESDMVPLAPQCGDVGGPDKDNPLTCIYPDGHPGLHSFEPTFHGESRCQAYGDRPCLYPEGHEGSHSYVGKCYERAADGQLCDLDAGHEVGTPHDWMATFGNPSIRCRTIWRQASAGYSRVWRCMFTEGHAGWCSFELAQHRYARCPTTNPAGARCWDRQGHNDPHRYLEATRERR